VGGNESHRRIKIWFEYALTYWGGGRRISGHGRLKDTMLIKKNNRKCRSGKGGLIRKIKACLALTTSIFGQKEVPSHGETTKNRRER